MFLKSLRALTGSYVPTEETPDLVIVTSGLDTSGWQRKYISEYDQAIANERYNTLPSIIAQAEEKQSA